MGKANFAMKAVDFRDATFRDLVGKLEGLRLQVYEAWVKHGPTTTRRLAQLCGIDLLTVRPRTTELVQLGLVEVSQAGECKEPVFDEFGQIKATMIFKDEQRDGHEGVYIAVAKDKWERWHESKVSSQLQLI